MMSMNDINVPALKERVTKIITDPSNEWLTIEPEPTTIEQLYKAISFPLLQLLLSPPSLVTSSSARGFLWSGSSERASFPAWSRRF